MSNADPGVDGDEEDEDNEDDTPMLSIPSRMRGATGTGSNGSSPRRAIAGGVTRTEKKRRSVTLAAGPSAAVAGVTRSRSGTMVGAAAAAAAAGLAALTSITPSISNSNPSLTLSPVDHHPHHNHHHQQQHPNGMNGDGRRDSLGNTNGNVNTNGSTSSSAAAGSTLGGQTNSPLAMKELSPSIKPMIEDHLLRYLNHLCMNRTSRLSSGLFFFSFFFFLSFHVSSTPQSIHIDPYHCFSFRFTDLEHHC